MTLFWFIFATAQIDLRTYLLPDVLTQPLLWLGLLYHSVYDREMLPDALYGAVAGYLTLWLVWWGCKILAGKEGIGTGDAKLLAAMGAGVDGKRYRPFYSLHRCWALSGG